MLHTDVPAGDADARPPDTDAVGTTDATGAPWRQRRPARFVREVLRGVAQVDFLPNAASGVLFAAALFASRWQYGIAGLLGAAVSTATAHALGVDRERVAAGLEGFNGCLVATTFAVYFGPEHLATWLVAVVGAVVATVVTGALARMFDVWQLPTLTLPFCMIATAMALAAPGLERVWHGAGGDAPALPHPASGGTGLSVPDLGNAFLANVGQIFLMPQWYVGLLFLAGIFVASWRLGLLACLGSVLGTVSAWALGAPGALVAQGLMGYNAVLVTMALGGVFLVCGRWSVAYAAVGAVVSTVLTTATTNLFTPVGGHAFTWPFVVTALLFLLAAGSFPRLRRA